MGLTKNLQLIGIVEIQVNHKLKVKIMTAPIFGLTNCWFGAFRKSAPNRTPDAYFKLVASVTALDTVISITGLVLGILGALSVISMPAAAAYALIGTSVAITALWGALAIKIFYGDTTSWG